MRGERIIRLSVVYMGCLVLRILAGDRYRPQTHKPGGGCAVHEDETKRRRARAIQGEL